MSSLEAFPMAEPVKVYFNTGTMLDILTGIWIKGTDGGHVLNGGLGPIVSIQGPPNGFKTELLLFLNMVVMSRYRESTTSVYDTEGSCGYPRLEKTSSRFPELADLDVYNINGDSRIRLTSDEAIYGDQYFELVKKISTERSKVARSMRKKTPMLDPMNRQVTAYSPLMSLVDTLSEFRSSDIQKKHIDKHEIGHAKNTTVFMRDGGFKAQYMMQLANVAARGGIIFMHTAHIGKEGALDDPMTPNKPKLNGSKHGLSAKEVGSKFNRINNILIDINSASVYKASGSPGVQYPKYPSDREERCKDLNKVTFTITRNKSGQSVLSFDFIVSQSEGLLPSLTWFHYLKETCKGYGIGGSDQRYFLELMPEVTLQRTTVRGLLDDDVRLQNAAEWTGQLHLMTQLMRGFDHLYCKPQELRDDLIKLGYDWDILLSARAWWTFEEEEKNLAPRLTLMDLLLMRAEEYRPKWYDAAVKAREKESKKEVKAK